MGGKAGVILLLCSVAAFNNGWRQVYYRTAVLFVLLAAGSVALGGA